jgi:hypothetical protein
MSSGEVRYLFYRSKTRATRKWIWKMGPSVWSSVLLNTFDLSSRHYRIKIKSGSKGEEWQSGSRQSLALGFLSAYSSQSTFLIILFLTKWNAYGQGRPNQTHRYNLVCQKISLEIDCKSFWWGIDGTVCLRLCLSWASHVYVTWLALRHFILPSPNYFYLPPRLSPKSFLPFSS